MKPHRHAEVIKEFVNGKECEYFDSLTKHWEKIEDLGDFVFDTVRVKPKPQPDVVDYLFVANKEPIYVPEINWVYENTANLRLIWDGETSKLKNAEVIK